MRLRLDIEPFVASGVPLDAYERCSKSCLHVLCVLEPLRHGCSGQSTSVAVRPTAPQPAAESAALVSFATSSFSSCSTWHTIYNEMCYATYNMTLRHKIGLQLYPAGCNTMCARHVVMVMVVAAAAARGVGRRQALRRCWGVAASHALYRSSAQPRGLPASWRQAC